MPNNTYEKGLQGEQEAIAYLNNKGMVLLQKRYHSLFGEIDLVMQDGDTIVFVEVKLRRTQKAGAGFLAVGKKKQQKIIKTALQYICKNNCDCTMRFDVVEITMDGIEHMENAFEAQEF